MLVTVSSRPTPCDNARDNHGIFRQRWSMLAVSMIQWRSVRPRSPASLGLFVASALLLVRRDDGGHCAPLHLFVAGRTIDRWYRHTEHAQIDDELAAVM